MSIVCLVWLVKRCSRVEYSMYRIDDQWHCITRTWLLWRDVFDVWSDDRFSWTLSGRLNRRGFSRPCVFVDVGLIHRNGQTFCHNWPMSRRTVSRLEKKEEKISCNHRRALFLDLCAVTFFSAGFFRVRFCPKIETKNRYSARPLPVTSRERMVKSSFFSLSARATRL